MKKFNESVLEGYQLVSNHLVMNEHLNPNHNIFGGQLLAWLDMDVYMHAANRVKYTKMATHNMNHIYFKNPALLGDFIQIYAKIKEIKKSSIITSGIAISNDPATGEKKVIIECEITYVVLDENGRPTRSFKPDINL